MRHFPPPAQSDFDAMTYFRVTPNLTAAHTGGLGLRPGDVVVRFQETGLNDSLMQLRSGNALTRAGTTSATLVAALVADGSLVALADAEPE